MIAVLSMEVLWSQCVDYREGGKPQYPEKNPQSKGEINCNINKELNLRK